MRRSKLLWLALLVCLIPASCGSQASRGPGNLVPTLCHSELGVGLLFITIENRGGPVGPSTTSVSFDTHSTKVPRLQLEVATPSMPSGALRWITVNLPYAPGTTSFLEPAGKVTIVVNAGHAGQAQGTVPTERAGTRHSPYSNASNTLVSNCTDAA